MEGLHAVLNFINAFLKQSPDLENKAGLIMPGSFNCRQLYSVFLPQ